MNRATDAAVRRVAATRGHAADNLTHVELTWIEKRIENWIRFGREAHEEILDRRRRVLSFRPGSIFAFVRWAANDFGTVLSRIDIVRAVEPGEAYQTLPFVRPGGDILLKIEAWPKVEQVLRHIDAVESADIDACDVAPDHWRHVANRMSAGHEPRLTRRSATRRGSSGGSASDDPLRLCHGDVFLRDGLRCRIFHSDVAAPRLECLG